MCGSCAALPGGNRLAGQSWPEGRRAAFLRRRLRWMDFVAHSHYLWIASGCILWLLWYTSDGLRRGEQWIALTYACKAVIGQRLVFCVWGLRPKFNSSASTSTRCATGNVRQRQRQPQPQQCMPAVVAASMLACLLLACCGSGEWHACRGGERARRCGVLGA